MNAQELLDKYIKYNSKITFDIFKLIYQKLIDLGFTTPHNVEEAFKEFSGKYPYFVMKLYGKPFFNQYNCNLIYQSEISVEDLLGYNPFGKLPEKWYIEVGENAEIINKWKQTTEYTDPASKYKYVTCRGSGYYRKSDYTDHSEITIKQFKQYVLKKPIETEIMETENDWTKATKEDLLEEAKRRYPVGCIFKCLVTNSEYVIKDYNEFKYEGKCIYSYINNLIYHKHYENNQWAEVVSLSESKVEESVPEYVECFYSETDAFIINKIYKCASFSKANALNLYSEKDFKGSLPYEGNLWKFKPSTKEAFEAQNKPNSIEKWSVGSYIVPLQDKLLTRDEPLIKGKLYQIIKRINLPYIICENGSEINFFDNSNAETTEGIKWFATQFEAEEFAKTLVTPIEDTIECETCNGEGTVMIGKLYPSGHTEVMEDCPDCNGDGFIDKPKQLLKQAVHCKTQEEWDFVTDKLGYKWTLRRFDETSWISLNANEYSSENYWKKNGYQILSFQEWCDLNGYKMKKTRFQAGDYVVSLRPENLSTQNIKSNYCYIQYKDADRISINYSTIMCETDFHYARLATPEEIEEYKRIGQPYDVTTLQSKTIVTYGLNIGDKLDPIIITAWEKKGLNYFSETGEWIFGSGVAYDKSRKITSFKIINGVVGFLVSGTLGIYLRAEGFKEFADNYYTKTTSNFKVGSWYKYKRFYLKYSKTNDENIFIASEYIDTKDNIFADKLTDFKCGDADGSKELVTDLALIQQYLPDGHPNKFIKLNGIPMEIKIETNSFYGSTLVQRFQFNKEEIYLLPDPD